MIIDAKAQKLGIYVAHTLWGCTVCGNLYPYCAPIIYCSCDHGTLVCYHLMDPMEPY